MKIELIHSVPKLIVVLCLSYFFGSPNGLSFRMMNSSSSHEINRNFPHLVNSMRNLNEVNNSRDLEADSHNQSSTGVENDHNSNPHIDGFTDPCTNRNCCLPPTIVGKSLQNRIPQIIPQNSEIQLLEFETENDELQNQRVHFSDLNRWPIGDVNDIRQQPSDQLDIFELRRINEYVRTSIESTEESISHGLIGLGRPNVIFTGPSTHMGISISWGDWMRSSSFMCISTSAYALLAIFIALAVYMALCFVILSIRLFLAK